MKRNFFRISSICFSLACLSAFSADKIHEVQKGETLYSISRSYGVSVDSVKALNNFSTNDIKIGQKIKIPENSQVEAKVQEPKKDSEVKAPADGAAASSETAKNASVTKKSETKKEAEEKKSSDGIYEVQKGETWFGISKKYGISVAELQKMNGVASDASLKVGQKLKVPSANDSASKIKVEDAVASAKTPASSKTEVKTEKKPDPKVPDLKSNDPHNYSTKKGDSSLVWPVKATDVTYVKGKVGGVCLTAKKDENVTSIRAGTVMFSGSYRGFGNVVFIQSKTGHIYAYTGLGSIEVAKGDYINYASRIGTAGVDTYTGKSQVNLMVFQNGQPIDPAKAPRG